MRLCPCCGQEMGHRVYNNRVYWVCPGCRREMVTPKSAEVLVGAV